MASLKEDLTATEELFSRLSIYSFALRVIFTVPANVKTFG
jgi:hypothetical protein